MTKTFLLIEITHTKPLPDKVPITDITGQRLYGYLYSQGVEAGVNVALVDMPKQPGEVDAD